MTKCKSTLISLQTALICLWVLSSIRANSQSCQINFAVDMRAEVPVSAIGVRGDLTPLSWDKTFYLEDKNGDGIFTGSLELKETKKVLQYKFVKNEDEFELNGDDNRILVLDQSQLSVTAAFNVYNPLSPEELSSIRFSPEAIREDLAVLKLGLRTIHPNLYRYQDSLELEQAFDLLEQQMREEPDLPAAYQYLTQLIAKIRCSHTITNPWNQKRRTKQAIFYQKDKVPFTFRILDKRIFIEKNASEEKRLTRGTEVLAINGIPAPELLERLIPYISADGSNDAKRWYSLQLNGTEKYEAFDIFFPLEFSLTDYLDLSLKDHLQDRVFTAEVSLISKSERSAILQKRYPELAVTDDALWSFEVLNETTAYLKLGTFVTWHMEMNWKKFLENTFRTLREASIPNLIIDIRDNAGGMDEVYAFIIERLIREPLTVNSPASKIAYQQIPDALRPHISTWDDSAFDLSKQTVAQPDGYFLSKPIEGKDIKLKPAKDAFQGKTYLITNAANSSATHYMAMYLKKYQLATLVGRPTGGNQRGLNGGMIFFTTLPNTQIEVDIPIFGSYTASGTPDGGIIPDIPVSWSVEDLVQGNDPDLKAILERLAVGN